MKENFLEAIEAVKKISEIEFYTEDDIKLYIVLRLLKILDWDIYNKNEVFNEYPVNGTKIDYCLIIRRINKYFIEVKRPKENLADHEEQLIGYCSHHGVKLATLTNGLTWWFYLPLTEGSWKEKKFFSIDILSQDSNDVADKFIDLLSKTNVQSGQALEVAEDLYKSRKKKLILGNTLPEAWNKIVSDPDEFLVDLMIETVEKLCGHKPSEDMVKSFLVTYKERFIIAEERPKPISRMVKLKTIERSQKSKTITARADKPKQMILNNTTYNLSKPSWEILVNTANWLIKQGKLTSKNCPVVVGPKRYLVHTIPEHGHRRFMAGRKLSNGLWIECHWSYTDAIKHAYTLIEQLGYSQSTLKIIY